MNSPKYTLRDSKTIPTLVFGLDPGPVKSGWALYDIDKKKIIQTGHDDWPTIIKLLKSESNSIRAVCVEKIIIHYGIPANQNLPRTSEYVGRVQQICEDNYMDFHQNPRINIMEKIYMRPKRGQKISKSKMQEIVQKMLKLEKPIRPQHVNDAICAILAEYPPDGKTQKE